MQISLGILKITRAREWCCCHRTMPVLTVLMDSICQTGWTESLLSNYILQCRRVSEEDKHTDPVNWAVGSSTEEKNSMIYSKKQVLSNSISNPAKSYTEKQYNHLSQCNLQNTSTYRTYFHPDANVQKEKQVDASVSRRWTQSRKWFNEWLLSTTK